MQLGACLRLSKVHLAAYSAFEPNQESPAICHRAVTLDFDSDVSKRVLKFLGENILLGTDGAITVNIVAKSSTVYVNQDYTITYTVRNSIFKVYRFLNGGC